MSIQTINYTDKESLITSPLPAENKIMDTDMNEIKSVVNNNANELGILISSGSNSNGTYIKFSNGTMICTKKVNLTNVIINTANGSLYRSDDISLGNFSESFLEKPVCFVDLSTSTFWGFLAYHTELSKTSAGKIQIYRPTTTTEGSYTVNIIAIGTYNLGG